VGEEAHSKIYFSSFHEVDALLSDTMESDFTMRSSYSGKSFIHAGVVRAQFWIEEVGGQSATPILPMAERLKAYRHWLTMPEPEWLKPNFPEIDYQDAYYYAAPKSNAAVGAWTSAKAAVREHGPLPVPMKLRNAVTKSMKDWGYGNGYRYPHNEGGYAEGETYLPDELVGERYYIPKDSGFETRIRDRLARLRKG